MSGRCSLALASICALAGCTREIHTLELPPRTVAALVIVETAEETRYLTLTDDPASLALDMLPEDARVTVLGYSHTLEAMELIDSEGDLNWATRDTPPAQRGPLPRPDTWWESVGADFWRRDPAQLSRPERLALSGCPELIDQPTQLRHGADAAAFVSPVPGEVWILAPLDGNDRSSAFRCTAQCDPQEPYPDGLRTAVGTADESRQVWYFDGAGFLRSFGGDELPLPEGVTPVGLAIDAHQIVVLDDRDQLHVYRRDPPAGWRAPRDLAALLPNSSTGCARARLAPSLWLDGDDAGMAVLAAHCQLVRFSPRERALSVEVLFPDGPFVSIAYARDEGHEAVLLDRSDGLGTKIYANDDGRGWVPVKLVMEVYADNLAVLGGDLMVLAPFEGTTVARLSHGWLGQRTIPRLACTGLEMQIQPPVRLGDELVALQSRGIPGLHRLRWVQR